MIDQSSLFHIDEAFAAPDRIASKLVFQIDCNIVMVQASSRVPSWN
jgi:hypothetical protein